ncbi:hypothetical protein LHYA1_G001365 [Lachnellula hyalina]|uniref:Fringe-like glycosyltransferase domain-containing protein n=1 Tax=Lachnellula hyalina TaxID=1316788 RepID=A0A8H8R669_9HELO|nr:uncharacterized protein LHYA1_G001365 [Lachnellula hyalina]TVY29328.1 hypothetical protein LHYA1_G001365 [Lachnellula hyalina]
MGALSVFALSRSRRSLSLVSLALCILATLVLLQHDEQGSFLRPARWDLHDILRPQPESKTQSFGTKKPTQPDAQREPVPEPQTQPQIMDLTHLAKYELTPSFTYSRRTIIPKASNGKRETLTKMEGEYLFNTPQVLNEQAVWNRSTSIDSFPPLTLHVPSSPEVDTSIISFGIATSASRVPEAFPNLEHWLSNTSSSIYVAVSDPQENELTELQSQLEHLNIKATLANSSLFFSNAYFSLIKELYDARTEKTEWLVLIDDDTFIPSLPTLLTHLNNAYDSSQELIISAASDNMDQIRIFGIQPYGGGGIFISVPLARILTQPEVWDSCMSSESEQGDQIVNECLDAHSPVRPTFDLGLNQMDIHGDFAEPAGYFENGRQMLTIHHWRSWFHIDMPAVATVSKACGDEGILMRWLFEGDVVLSNGYSIAEYPRGISETDLQSVELTWSDDVWKFMHHIGPLREKMGRDQKRSFGMVETVVLEEGVRQTYLEKAEEIGMKKVGMDRVVELLWLFD